MRILIVEDEEKIAGFVARALASEGYFSSMARDGGDALAMMNLDEFELVILDLMLPDRSGLEVLSEIRGKKVRTPVIILTAKDDVESKVQGLELGADDYVTKPFSLEELLARIRAVVRRKKESDRRSSSYQIGGIAIDLLARELRTEHKKVPLSTKEFALLEYFLQHPNEVISRQRILSNVWSYDFDPGSNVVDVYVRYLRKKFADLGCPKFIETVRGTGYRARVN